MAGNLSIPHVFATQSGNVPASQLDNDYNAIRDYVNAREVTSGALAERPAAGVSGRWYFATDDNGGTLYVDTGSVWVKVAPAVAQAALSGHLFGLTLSNNATDPTNDLDIAVGEAASDDAAASARVLMELTTALVKRLDANWAAGTNQGMLDTGTVANGTYHIFLIKNLSTGVVDVLASTSPTAPTMPSGFTKKRRIGSILRESGGIVAFSQVGDEFMRKASVLDVNVTNPGTAAVLRTLSVPTGITVVAIFNASVQQLSSGSVVAYWSDPAVNDEAPSTTAAPLHSLSQSLGGFGAHVMAARLTIRTNTSAQVRSRVSNSDANTTLRAATLGWVDTRGRDA